MPQFDFATFFVQAFWLTLGLSVFFITFNKFILVQALRTLRIREKLIFSSSKKVNEGPKTGVITSVLLRV